MKYAKLVNNSISYAPRKIRHNGRWYFNAPEEIMRAEGYKPVVYEEMPEFREGFYIEPIYRETEREIHVYWEYKPLENEE